MSQNQMFCYQCEQTAKGQGCTVVGVCGKNADVAALQDLLVYMLRGLGQLSTEARAAGVKDENIDLFACEALFVTLTNVNFDPEAITSYIKKTATYQEQLRSRLYAVKAKVNSPFNLKLEETTAGMIAQGKLFGVNSEPLDADLHSLQWLLTYGLKGVAAYAFHAALLGKKDDKVFDFIHLGIAAPLDKSLGVNDFVGLVFKCGEINVRAMELLDAGNTETYGHPTPTKVPLGHKRGKAILFRDTTSSTSTTSSSKPRAWASRFTLMAKCCQPTDTPPSKSTRTSLGTTVRLGRTSRKSSRRFQAPS